MPNDANPRPSAAADPRGRVQFLLDAVWRNNQRAMARDLGMTQGLVSKVINGVQSPGPRLLAALAQHPRVNEEWMYSGVGEPLLPPTAGTLPVAVGVLPGWPERHPELLTGDRHPVAAAFDRPSRYWVRVEPTCSLQSDPELALLPNDLLLMDADVNVWAGRLDQMAGRVFGLKVETAGNPPMYVLARLFKDERGLGFDLYPIKLRQAAELAPPPAPTAPLQTERPIRRLRSLSKPAADAAVTESAVRDLVEPTFRPSDIVAVRVYTARP